MSSLKPKHYIYFVLIFWCFNGYTTKAKQTYIAGNFENCSNDTITLVAAADYFSWVGTTNPLAQAVVDSTGNFQFILENFKADFYQILKNNYPVVKYDLFIEPGDSIFIEQSLWGEELFFTIKGKDELNYLEKDFKVLPDSENFRDKLRSSDFKTLASFKAYIDSLKQIRITTLMANKLISDKCKNHFTNEIKTESANHLISHLERRNYYMGEEWSYFHPKDSSYYSILNELSFDSLFCKTKSAKNLARTYLNDLGQKAFKGKSDSLWWENGFAWQLDYVTNQPKSLWNDFLALSMVQEYSQNMYLDNFFQLTQSFDETMNHHFVADQNLALFKENTIGYLTLMPGKHAPNFELPDSTGKLIQLSDFKDKIVYIDFWGTWCYPCIQEIPDALKLQQKYKDEPIVFLYVAMESEDKIDEWKQFIAGKDERFADFLDNKRFPGIHLVAKDQTRNEQIAAYKINAAPTHVLIDHKGNIVKARAGRSDTISEQLDELLKKM